MMNYTLTPSLEHTALIKIATTLWNQDDIRALTARFYFRSFLLGERQREWRVIEDKVIEKIPQLPQPKPLKKKVLNFIKPIGLEILNWRESHESFSSERKFVVESLNRLCWTQPGTVDKKKTAEVLIKDESLDITSRYKLACIYCLENDILELWNKIPENCRKSFYSEEDPRNVRQQELVVLWTYDIKGEVARMDNMIERRWQCRRSPYQYALEYAAVGGNKAATEYFLQKLTPSEREESLVRSTGYVASTRCYSGRNRTDLPKEHYADVLCLLLSQMNEVQQVEVFKRNPRQVLKCFIDWPWQSLFMKTANHVLNFLSEEDCNYFLREMADEVIDGHNDYDYRKLFGEFWQQIPNAHKRYIIRQCANGFLLSKLFKIKDEKNIKMIFKDATLKEKKLIFCYKGQNICQDLIYGDNLDLLELFIRECISSRKDMIKFKEEFKERMTRCSKKEEFAKNKDKWNKFFQLLDDFICGYDKRKIVEGNSSPARRLRSTEFKEVTRSTEKIGGKVPKARALCPNETSIEMYVSNR